MSRHSWMLPTSGLVLALTLVACGSAEDLAKNRVVRELPGVEVITGPIPPLYASTILGLRAPQGVGVTADATRLYVAEGDGDRAVKVIDLVSREARESLAPPGTVAATRKPTSIFVGPNGVVYVVDRLRLAVDMYDPDGRWLGMLPDPPLTSGQWEPLGVSLNAEGEVYVVNGAPDGPLVAEYDANGVFVSTLGTMQDESGSFSFPAGVATGTVEEQLYIADSNNGRIVAIDAEGRIEDIYGNQGGQDAVALPRGMYIDHRGYCYVTDATGHEVKVWDVSKGKAKYLFSFGQPGIADGEFLYPNAVAVDGEGRVYVADTGNDRVQIWAY